VGVTERLAELFESAEEIVFNNSSRLILFSDCHRGDNSWADEFADNQNLFFHALDHYYRNGFIYIEIGDGEELWENARFEDIRKAHSHIYWLMNRFHKEGRLHLIWGNHDIERKDWKRAGQGLLRYYDKRTQDSEGLFENIDIHEGLILRHEETGRKIFLIHGHQADPFNDRFWFISKWINRYIWKYLQLLGVRDPTSPAHSLRRQVEIEGALRKWAETRKQPLVAGHTHNSSFPVPQGPSYFNTGSCVHPRCITGIEIENGELLLIKWWVKTREDGSLFVGKDRLVEEAWRLGSSSAL
jgi:predicted phosphodiesterase